MPRNHNAPEDLAREEDDEGAQRFNEALDEGSVYLAAHPHVCADSEIDFDDQRSKYRDPELCDPEEETLPPGEMELIFENNYIM